MKNNLRALKTSQPDDRSIFFEQADFLFFKAKAQRILCVFASILTQKSGKYAVQKRAQIIFHSNKS